MSGGVMRGGERETPLESPPASLTLISGRRGFERSSMILSGVRKMCVCVSN